MATVGERPAMLGAIGRTPLVRLKHLVGSDAAEIWVKLESYPGLLRLAVEPAESPALSEGRSGTHHIEGGGVGFRPPLLELDDFDEVIPVPEQEAFALARRTAREEGLMSGPSTGANLRAALTLAERLGPGARVVTTQVDSGLKYLTGALYAN